MTQYDGFMLRRYSKAGHQFFTAAANTLASFVLLSSGKMTDFTDRKGLLPLLSGETANFTDGEGIWSMLSVKMTDFTDRSKTTGIMRWKAVDTYKSLYGLTDDKSALIFS